MGCCTVRLFCYLSTLWLYGWVGIFVALDLFHICSFLMGKIVLKYVIMHVAHPKQEECLGGSCILVRTVTTFHSNIRHRPTQISVQTAKNYKWIMVYLLASWTPPEQHDLLLLAWELLLALAFIF